MVVLTIYCDDGNADYGVVMVVLRMIHDDGGGGNDGFDNDYDNDYENDPFQELYLYRFLCTYRQPAGVIMMVLTVVTLILIVAMMMMMMMVMMMSMIINWKPTNTYVYIERSTLGTNFENSSSIFPKISIFFLELAVIPLTVPAIKVKFKIIYTHPNGVNAKLILYLILFIFLLHKES